MSDFESDFHSSEEQTQSSSDEFTEELRDLSFVSVKSEDAQDSGSCFDKGESSSSSLSNMKEDDVVSLKLHELTELISGIVSIRLKGLESSGHPSSEPAQPGDTEPGSSDPWVSISEHDGNPPGDPSVAGDQSDEVSDIKSQEQETEKLQKDEDQLLLDSFNHTFEAAITDIAVIYRLLTVPQVNEWYHANRGERGVGKPYVPRQWQLDSAGMPEEFWAEALKKKKARDKARTKAQKQIHEIRVKYNKEVLAIQKRLEAQLNSYRLKDHKVTILEAGYRDLSLKDKIEIQCVSKTERPDISSEKLAAARKVWVKRLEEYPYNDPIHSPNF